MTLKVAVVGLGGIGTRHADIYNADDRCELVAVCDALPDKASAAADRYGCKSFSSVSEMIESQEIDIASVCTAGVENGGDHYEPTMALLGAGIPVLGEKPISNRIPEAREMVAFAKEKGLRYGINLNHRFTPAAVRAREWVDGGRLGELNIVNMTMWINNPNESSPVLPHACATPSFDRCDAVLLRRCAKSSSVLQTRNRAQNLVERAGQHAV